MELSYLKQHILTLSTIACVSLILVLQIQHLDQKLTTFGLINPQVRQNSRRDELLLKPHPIPTYTDNNVFEEEEEEDSLDFLLERENIYQERREQLEDVCRQFNISTKHGGKGSFKTGSMVFSLREKTVFCPNGKTGTSTWMDHFKDSLDMLPENMLQFWATKGALHGRYVNICCSPISVLR